LTQRTTDGLEALSRSTAQQTGILNRKMVEGLEAIDRKLEALNHCAVKMLVKCQADPE
jgi:hypothetical protein